LFIQISLIIGKSTKNQAIIYESGLISGKITSFENPGLK